MNKVFLVKFSDLDESGILCAFTNKEEADKYVLALELEKDEDLPEWVYFYSTEVNLYNDCTEVVGNA
jgi:hypothetical protein